MMIQARNLTKYYGSHRAVNNINFDLDAGEILGLLGPNGAGKSTTMRMVTGFLRPTSGTIRIAGHSVTEESLACRRLVGYLPEFAPLYTEMVVYDYLRFVARIRNVEERSILEEVRRVAALCGLAEVMHQAFHELSRGYKQRVGLAHAIIGDPEILILDEATSGLDPNQIVEIRTLIKTIGKKKSVIFSTHSLGEAEATCDRIVIIHNGGIVADSTPKALRQSLRGNSVLNLTLENATFAAVESALSQLEGITEITEIGGQDQDDDLVRIRILCDDEARRAVHRRIKSEDWMLLELSAENQSLEAVFRELTEHVDDSGLSNGA